MNPTDTPPPAVSRTGAWVGLHTAVLLFGIPGLFAKTLGLPSLAIVVGRTGFAALALLLLLVVREGRLPRWHGRQEAWLLLAGVTLAVHWATFFHAIQVSTVAVGLITYSSYPLFVTLLEPVLAGTRLRGADVLAALGIMAGLALIPPSLDLGDRVTLGALWGTLSGFSFAVLTLLNRRLAPVRGPVELALAMNFVAACVLAPWVVGSTPWPDGRQWAMLAVLGVVCTALSHALFLTSLTRLRAQIVSVVAGLEAVYGVVFAWLLFAEVPAPRTLAGGLLILGTVTVASWRSRGSQDHPPVVRDEVKNSA